MTATLGRWVIRTKPSKHLGSEVGIRRIEVAKSEVSPGAMDLEESAGDFIARHVLEKDSEFFDG